MSNEEIKEGKRFYVSIDRVIHARLQRVSTLTGRTMIEATEAALKSYLDTFESDPSVQQALKELEEVEKLRIEAEQRRNEALKRLQEIRSKL